MLPLVDPAFSGTAVLRCSNLKDKFDLRFYRCSINIGQLQNIVPSFVAVRSQNSVSNTLEQSIRNRGWQVPQLTGLTKKVFWHVAFLTSLCRIIRVLQNGGWNLVKSFR